MVSESPRMRERERKDMLPVTTATVDGAARKGANSDLVCRKIYNSRSGRERKKSGE